MKSFANLRLWFVEWAGESYPAGQCVHDLATSSFPSLEAVLEVAHRREFFTGHEQNGLARLCRFQVGGDCASAKEPLHAALRALWLAAKYEEREER